MAAIQLLKCYKPLIFPLNPSIQTQFRKFFINSSISKNFHKSNTRKTTTRFCSFSSTPSLAQSDSPKSRSFPGDGEKTLKGQQLWLYNTMSRERELFKPKVDGKVGMYVCGVTAYDLSHIGHARVYVSFDVLFRQIPTVLGILDRGSAYRIDGDVFFSVDEFPQYGRLSGRKLEDNRAGERVAVDSRKKNPADFALWKSTKEGEPFWESPWGPGRPGWHIECSAMSAAYLGYAFDIHGGGMDLVFPHHENEIAQSCAACEKSNISYWMHNGFVTIDSQKMSKSLGNFFTIRQVIDLYHPLALRLFLIGTHYRSPINYSDAQLESASERAYYIYQTLHDCETVLSQHDESSQKGNLPTEIVDCIRNFNDVFLTSMSDDLHSTVVLSAMSDPLKTANDLLHTRKGKKQGMRIQSLAALEKTLRNVLDILGLMPSSHHEVLQQLREKALKRAKLTEEHILEKIAERATARKNKEYEKSDAIREELAIVGIALMDTPEGTSWRPAIPLAMQEHVSET